VRGAHEDDDAAHADELDRLHRAAVLHRMQRHHVAVALESLGRQLVVAGALCAAFDAGGWNYNQRLFDREGWRPGCQRRMP
jgi:hypothetical protein